MAHKPRKKILDKNQNTKKLQDIKTQKILAKSLCVEKLFISLNPYVSRND
jgi:hypothetical protein